MPASRNEDTDKLFLKPINRNLSFEYIWDEIDKNFARVAEFLETFGRNTRIEHFTAQQGQEVFVLAGQYNLRRNCLSVYVNNIRQWLDTGFIETTKDTFKLVTPASAGDKVVAVYTRYYTLMDDLPEQYSNLITQINEDVSKANDAVSQLNAALVVIESYIHGGTGTRAGEDYDNAKYWAEEAYRNATESWKDKSLDAEDISYKSITVGQELDADRREIDRLTEKFRNLSCTDVRYGAGTIDQAINGIVERMNSLTEKYREIFGEDSVGSVIIANRDNIQRIQNYLDRFSAENVSYRDSTVKDFLDEKSSSISSILEDVATLQEDMELLKTSGVSSDADSISYNGGTVGTELGRINEKIREISRTLDGSNIDPSRISFQDSNLADILEDLQDLVAGLSSTDIRHGTSNVGQALDDLNSKVSLIDEIKGKMDEIEEAIENSETVEGLSVSVSQLRTLVSSLKSSDIRHGDSTVKDALDAIGDRISSLRSVDVKYGTSTVGATLDSILMDIRNLETDDILHKGKNLSDKIDEIDSDISDLKQGSSDSETIASLQAAISELTKKVQELENQGGSSEIADGAEAHNQVFSGKSLGSEITEDQISSIANGTFSGMAVGDYWTNSDGEKFRIAGFDLLMGVGPSNISEIVSNDVSLQVANSLLQTFADEDENYQIDFHHVIVVPDIVLSSGKFPEAFSVIEGEDTQPSDTGGEDTQPPDTQPEDTQPEEVLVEYDEEGSYSETFLYGGEYVGIDTGGEDTQPPDTQPSDTSTGGEDTQTGGEDTHLEDTQPEDISGILLDVDGAYSEELRYNNEKSSSDTSTGGEDTQPSDTSTSGEDTQTGGEDTQPPDTQPEDISGVLLSVDGAYNVNLFYNEEKAEETQTGGEDTQPSDTSTSGEDTTPESNEFQNWVNVDALFDDNMSYNGERTSEEEITQSEDTQPEDTQTGDDTQPSDTQSEDSSFNGKSEYDNDMEYNGESENETISSGNIQVESPSETVEGENSSFSLNTFSDEEEFDESSNNPFDEEFNLSFVSKGHRASWYAKTPSGWRKVDGCLLNEISVFGTKVLGNQEATELTTQFPIFRLSPERIRVGRSYWLSDKSGEGDEYCEVSQNGSASKISKLQNSGFRPFFMIK